MDKHSCTIIIDTNQFCGDYMLSNVRWRNLLLYLEKTNASLQMPQIIWEEIARNYRKNLEIQFNQATIAIRKINHNLLFNAERLGYVGHAHQVTLKGMQLETSEITEKYMCFLKESLRLKTKDFIQENDKWFSAIVTRAIEHRKPFAEDSDKGFKDTLLWTALISLGKKPGFKDAPMVLITANSRDFGNPSSAGKLHPSLVKEAGSAGLDVHYFENLDTFFENWAAEALNINFDKVRKSIPEQLIKDGLEKFIRPYMSKKEAAIENTFITGMSFKVTSEKDGDRTIKMSISGYITNSVLPTTYLDFSAEAAFEEKHNNKKFEVESFTLLDQITPLHAWLLD